MDLDILGLLEGVKTLITDFQAGSLIGLATLLYLIIQVLRGKAGFKIPFLTKLWNKIQSKNLKTWILLGMFGLAGGATALTQAESMDFMVFLDGVLTGLGLGITTLGLRHTAKTTIESDSAQKLKENMKKALKKDEVQS